jgi:hypothetical protein
MAAATIIITIIITAGITTAAITMAVITADTTARGPAGTTVHGAAAIARGE